MISSKSVSESVSSAPRSRGNSTNIDAAPTAFIFRYEVLGLPASLNPCGVKFAFRHAAAIRGAPEFVLFGFDPPRELLQVGCASLIIKSKIDKSDTYN
jgi:hypothetical protein